MQVRRGRGLGTGIGQDHHLLRLLLKFLHGCLPLLDQRVQRLPLCTQLGHLCLQGVATAALGGRTAGRYHICRRYRVCCRYRVCRRCRVCRWCWVCRRRWRGCRISRHRRRCTLCCHRRGACGLVTLCSIPSSCTFLCSSASVVVIVATVLGDQLLLPIGELGHGVVARIVARGAFGVAPRDRVQVAPFFFASVARDCESRAL